MTTWRKNCWSASLFQRGGWTAGLSDWYKKEHRQIHLSHVPGYLTLAVLGSWIMRKVIKAAHQKWWRFFFLPLCLYFSVGCKALIWNGKYRNFVSKFHHKDIYTMKSGNVYFPYCFFWWTGLLSHVSAIHNQCSTKAEKLIISCATPVCCHPFLFIKEMNNYKGSKLNCNYCSLPYLPWAFL